jgi:hypothetical protein
MQLTKLRAAPVLQAEVPPCAPAGQLGGGTASQLIRGVRRTKEGALSRIARVACIGILLAPGVAIAAPQRTAQGLELRLEEWQGMRLDIASPLSLAVAVRPSGEVSRQGDAPPGPTHVGEPIQARLQKLLTDERFFSLSRKPEACPPDLGFRTIAATVAGRQHEISFCGRDTRSATVRSLLRIWYGTLAQVSDPGTVRVPTAYREIIRK